MIRDYRITNTKSAEETVMNKRTVMSSMIKALTEIHYSRIIPVLVTIIQVENIHAEQ